MKKYILILAMLCANSVAFGMEDQKQAVELQRFSQVIAKDKISGITNSVVQNMENQAKTTYNQCGYKDLKKIQKDVVAFAINTKYKLFITIDAIKEALEKPSSVLIIVYKDGTTEFRQGLQQQQQQLKSKKKQTKKKTKKTNKQSHPQDAGKIIRTFSSVWDITSYGLIAASLFRKNVTAGICGLVGLGLKKLLPSSIVAGTNYLNMLTLSGYATAFGVTCVSAYNLMTS